MLRSSIKILTVRHLARDHAIDHHALHRYVLAGGGNAKELAAMRAIPWHCIAPQLSPIVWNADALVLVSS
jgi:hypothetical protein